MAIKVNLKPQIKREMEALVPQSGARSKTEYINMAVHEKNKRLRQEQQSAVLRRYFADGPEELRAINRELRSAARAVDAD